VEFVRQTLIIDSFYGITKPRYFAHLHCCCCCCCCGRWPLTSQR